MKKVSFKLLMMLLGVIAFSVVFIACDDDEVDPCVEITEKATAKVKLVAEKYEKDQTAENCKAYKKVIEEYLVETKDCPNANREKYNEVLKTLDCEELEMKENIVGKWVIEKATRDGVIDNDLTDYACSTKKDYIEFMTNGDFIDVYYDKDCIAEIDGGRTWKIDASSLIIEAKANESDVNKRIVKSILKIKYLTENEMILLLDKWYINGKEQPFEDENKDGKKDEQILYLERMK